MQETIIKFINTLVNNPEMTTFIIAMLPIVELRGSIPWAYIFGGLSLQNAILISIIGNFVIIIPILLILPILDSYISYFTHGKKMTYGAKYLNWMFQRAKIKGDLIAKYKFWGLVIFVGIPLPVTGAWTGSVAAYTFGVSYLRSLIAILLGLIISSSIVSVLLLSGQYIID